MTAREVLRNAISAAVQAGEWHRSGPNEIDAAIDALLAKHASATLHIQGDPKPETAAVLAAAVRAAYPRPDTPADDLTWRPWASAPADGRVIAVAWIDKEERRLDGPDLAKVWPDGAWRCLPYSDVMDERRLPTHWAPIPADPYATEGTCSAAEAHGG